MSDKLQTIAELMFGYIKVNFVLMKPVLCDDGKNQVGNRTTEEAIRK